MKSQVNIAQNGVFAMDVDKWLDSHNQGQAAFVSDSQDLQAISQNFGNRRKLSAITGALVVTGNGEYAHVWVTWSSRPYSTSALFHKVTLRIYARLNVL